MARPMGIIVVLAMFFSCDLYSGVVLAQETCGVSSVVQLQPLDVPANFHDEEDVPAYRTWGFVCCRSDGVNFSATLNSNDKLYELPNGGGSCNGQNAAVNRLIRLKVDKKRPAAGRCPKVAGKAYVPCEISLKGDLSEYLDRKRPCTYNPVLSFTCSLDGSGDAKIRTDIHVGIVDRNAAPQWSASVLEIGPVSEHAAAGAWLAIPQLGQGLSVSESRDIWGSENSKVSFSVRGMNGQPPVVTLDGGATMYPDPRLTHTGNGLARPALRLARKIDYDSCRTMVSGANPF